MLENPPIEYGIEPFDQYKYVLYSVVATDFGGPAKNYVATGTLEECEKIKARLEALDNGAL